MENYLEFENTFRGSKERIKAEQKMYLEHFKSCKKILDIGCGRGEFLEVLNEKNIGGFGIDLDPDMIDACKSLNLKCEKSNAIDFLKKTKQGEFDGVFCSHVIEHLEAEEAEKLIELLSHKLNSNAKIVFITPNSESLRVHYSSFWMDPTHKRLYPPALIRYFLEKHNFKVTATYSTETNLHVDKLKEILGKIRKTQKELQNSIEEMKKHLEKQKTHQSTIEKILGLSTKNEDFFLEKQNQLLQNQELMTEILENLFNLTFEKMDLVVVAEKI